MPLSRPPATDPATGRSDREENLNALTHAVGAALSIAGLSVLVAHAASEGDPWRVVSFSIYGATLVTLYLASTLYHTFRRPRLKHYLRLADHSAIFLLIAGTYTPFTLVNMRGPWGWTLFGIIWGLAIAGVTMKLLFGPRFMAVSVSLYIAMGWIVVIAIKPTLESIPAAGILWMVMGGVAYTSGVVFFAWKTLPYSHAIWHLFVMAGSMCHFIAVLFHALPQK
jgi:hemolysin III